MDCFPACSADFNPLPPCGGRQWFDRMRKYGFTISIHSLRVEGDNKIMAEAEIATAISIHSLRVEGDDK